MAITVTTDLTDLSLCESTTDNGTFYRLAGTSSANPALDNDAYAQGGGCIANKLGATTAADVGGHFNRTSTFDITGKHLYHWRLILTAGNMETKANKGITVGLTNTSTTSTSTWSTTNFKQWNLDGKDTVPLSTGWVCYALDPTIVGDASAGTLTLSTVKNIGFICRQLTSVTTTVSNQFIDSIRMGTGITGVASSAGDTISFASLYATDSALTNSWGIITKATGIYYGAGKMTIGSVTQTNTCLFKDTNAVLVWRNFKVASSLYEFKLLGVTAVGQTTFQLGTKDGSGNTSDGCVVRGEGTAVWTITCGAYTEFKAYASSLTNCLTATLSSTSELKNTSVASSGTFDVNGATITGCIFASQTATQLKVETTGEMAVITNSTFTSGGTGHAIELTVVGTYAFTNLTFNNFAATDGSTGNEAVYVSATSGTVTINVTGGTTPTIRTAGATVVVVAGAVTVSLTVQTPAGVAIQNANTLVKAAAGGSLPFEATVTITNLGIIATVTHIAHGLATNDKILIKRASLQANNGVYPIVKIDANSYSYTMASSPGSSPTGTIKATFVVLSGLTSASGQITMSRVFASAQPVTGLARKSTGSPLYKTALITGTVSSSLGAAFSAILLNDE